MFELGYSILVFSDNVLKNKIYVDKEVFEVLFEMLYFFRDNDCIRDYIVDRIIVFIMFKVYVSILMRWYMILEF